MSQFGVQHWVILGVIAVALWAIVRHVRADSGRGLVCLDCGTTGRAKAAHAGSFLGELGVWILMFLIAAFTGLWLLMLIALVFSLWRVFSRKRVCGACGSARLAPVDTPVAQQMLRTLDRSTSDRKD